MFYICPLTPVGSSGNIFKSKEREDITVWVASVVLKEDGLPSIELEANTEREAYEYKEMMSRNIDHDLYRIEVKEEES